MMRMRKKEASITSCFLFSLALRNLAQISKKLGATEEGNGGGERARAFSFSTATTFSAGASESVSSLSRPAQGHALSTLFSLASSTMMVTGFGLGQGLSATVAPPG